MLKLQCDIGISDAACSRRRYGRIRDRIYQVTKIALLTLTSTGLLLVALRCLFVPLLVYTYPDSKPYLLDSGIYGAYPTQKYVSTGLTSPQSSVLESHDSCTAGLVLLSVEGNSVAHSAPTIMDMAGNLVWTASDQYGEASANTKIQRYRGQDYLTFWAGEKLQESGLGSYYMLNSSYELVHTVSAVGEHVEGDLHEFKITEEGTALITVYERIFVDLDATNIELLEGQRIVDCVLQEINIETGELVFEWRSSDHLDHPDLQISHGGAVADGSFDYFHMNSIDKDAKGNYLISLRHLHLLVYVQGRTGEILWTLGHNAGDFEDMSQGAASSFRWQHDARWVSEEDGIISLFDNRIARNHHDADYSQGLMIQLDFTNWTVALLQEYTSRDHIQSPSQGDVQLLKRPQAEDHVFMGWGASAAFTEHDIDGNLLCETHFGASGLFWFERVKSYRAFKTFDWKAVPNAWDPEARIANDKVYVSWNGATEVAYWVLQSWDEDANATDWLREQQILKGEKFEYSFLLPETFGPTTYRIAALDSNHDVLRYSNEVVHEQTSSEMWNGGALVFGVLVLGACYSLYLRRRSLLKTWNGRYEGKEVFEYHTLRDYEQA